MPPASVSAIRGTAAPCRRAEHSNSREPPPEPAQSPKGAFRELLSPGVRSALRFLAWRAPRKWPKVPEVLGSCCTPLMLAIRHAGLAQQGLLPTSSRSDSTVEGGALRTGTAMPHNAKPPRSATCRNACCTTAPPPPGRKGVSRTHGLPELRAGFSAVITTVESNHRQWGWLSGCGSSNGAAGCISCTPSAPPPPAAAAWWMLSSKAPNSLHWQSTSPSCWLCCRMLCALRGKEKQARKQQVATRKFRSPCECA